MKKLITMIIAVAMGFGSFADANSLDPVAEVTVNGDGSGTQSFETLDGAFAAIREAETTANRIDVHFLKDTGDYSSADGKKINFKAGTTAEIYPGHGEYLIGNSDSTAFTKIESDIDEGKSLMFQADLNVSYKGTVNGSLIGPIVTAQNTALGPTGSIKAFIGYLKFAVPSGYELQVEGGEEGSMYTYTAKRVSDTFKVSFVLNDTVWISDHISDLDHVPYGSTWEIEATPKWGYELTSATYEGWEKQSDGKLIKTITVTGDTTVVAPVATPVVYTISYEFTGVADEDRPKIVNGNPTTYTVKSGTITFADATCEGYAFKGWDIAKIDSGSTGDKTITGAFEKGSSGYPSDWPATDDATKAKFAIWVAGKGAGADLKTDAAKNAFLLNCTVAEVAAESAAFRITAFTGTKDSVVTPTANTKGDAFNGAITVRTFGEVTCETQVDPASQVALFFKAFLGFPAAK